MGTGMGMGMGTHVDWDMTVGMTVGRECRSTVDCEKPDGKRLGGPCSLCEPVVHDGPHEDTSQAALSRACWAGPCARWAWPVRLQARALCGPVCRSWALPAHLLAFFRT